LVLKTEVAAKESSFQVWRQLWPKKLSRTHRHTDTKKFSKIQKIFYEYTDLAEPLSLGWSISGLRTTKKAILAQRY
jgi:hypothetical protein